MSNTEQKIDIRKTISYLKKMLKSAKSEDRYKIINAISYSKELLNNLDNGQSTETLNLPTIGKLRDVIEKDFKEELNKYKNDFNKSDVDLKRLTLKEAFLEYYNNVDCSPDVVVVDYEGDMTLRRDNKRLDGTDFDFAPNKNKIYAIWMDRLKRYVNDGRLNVEEYDESADRGIPQGGAFEKQLDRYRKDIMVKLWQDYYQKKGK